MMKKINGNKDFVLKVKDYYDKNGIGENVPVYIDYFTLKNGFLDMSNTNTNYTTYNSKIQDSTHFFICDYQELPKFIDVNGNERKPKIDELKAYCDGKEYDVLYIDNVQELNYHYEIYLQYKGV